MNEMDKLRELKALLDEGILTQAEFNGQMAKLLEGVETPKTSLLPGEEGGSFAERREAAAGDGRPPAMDAGGTAVRESRESHPPPLPVGAGSTASERQNLEKRLSSLGHGGCLDIEPLVVNVILAFFLPFLWIPVVVWIVATIVAHAKRSEARGALKANSVEVARASLDAAKTWYAIRFTVSLALWGTEFYGIYSLLKGFASFAEALQSL